MIHSFILKNIGKKISKQRRKKEKEFGEERKITGKQIKKILFRKSIFIFLLLISTLVIIGFVMINFISGMVGGGVKTIRSHTLINPQIKEAFERMVESGKNVMRMYQEYMQCLIDPWRCPRINPYRNVKAKEAKEVVEKQYGIHVLKPKILDGYTNPTLLYYSCTPPEGCILDSKNSLFSQPPHIFTYLKFSFLEPKDVKIRVLLKYIEEVEEIEEQEPCVYYPILSAKDKIIFEEVLQNVKETTYPIHIPLDFKDFDFSDFISACSSSKGYFRGDNKNITAQFKGAVNDIIVEVSYDYSTTTDTYLLLVRSEACVAAELKYNTIFDYLKIDPKKYSESVWIGDRGVYAAVSSPIAETGNYICINIEEVSKTQEYPIYLYIVFRKIDEESYIKNTSIDLQIHPFPEKGYEILGLSDKGLRSIINEKGSAGYILILNYSSSQLLNLFEGRDFIEVKISATTRGDILHKLNLGRLKIFNQELS